ncbi:MAG: hypothetical protein NVSMB51_02330 [Solirubrobacteraceae bacterium]
MGDELSRILQALLRAQTDIASAANDELLVMQLAVDHAPMLAGASGGMLERLQNDTLEARATAGALAACRGRRRPLTGTLAAQALAQGSAALDEDRARLAIPIVHEREPTGAMTLQTQEAGGFTPAQVHAMEVLGTLVGACLAPDGCGHAASELIHQAAVATLPDGVVVLDASMTIVTANAAASRIAGRPVSWLEGSGVQGASWGVVTESGEPLPPDQHPAARALRSGEVQAEEVLGVRRADGALAWLLVSAEPLLDAQGAAAQVVVHLRGLEQRERAGERDLLTGLPARGRLLADLVNALARARRTQRAVGLITIDFDDFRALNARWGHEAGDRILTQAGERITHVLRAGELCARYGEDELAVLLPDLGSSGGRDDRAALALVAERVTARLHRPFDLELGATPVGVSVGTALFPHDAQELDGLLGELDASLQADKRLKEL